MAVLPPDPIFRIRGDMGHIHSVCFADYESEHTSALLAATESGFVYIWDIQVRKTFTSQDPRDILLIFVPTPNNCSEPSLKHQVSHFLPDSSSQTQTTDGQIYPTGEMLGSKHVDAK